MRIDKTHRPWLNGTAIVLATSTVVYVTYATTSPAGPSGGSEVGLVFGIVGYAAMLFAGLLGMRKKIPLWRIGRAQTWMRGHLWLGLLTLPLILYHAGFVWRGPLTTVLMILLIIVWLSGIVGAIIQHYVPQTILRQVPLETIYEEIPHVRAQLLEEADRIVTGTALEQVYAGSIRPALADGADVAFAPFYRVMPSEAHPALKNLESICEEQRQLTHQRKLYHLLHTWLLVHVPLSIVLLVLGAIHAIIALRY